MPEKMNLPGRLRKGHLLQPEQVARVGRDYPARFREVHFVTQGPLLLTFHALDLADRLGVRIAQDARPIWGEANAATGATRFHEGSHAKIINPRSLRAVEVPTRLNRDLGGVRAASLAPSRPDRAAP